MSIWTDDKELHREEARALFVLGVLATLVGYVQVKDTLHLTELVTGFLALLIPLLLGFWGVYVVAMAVSMAETQNKWLRWVLEVVKLVGTSAFNIGAAFTVGLSAFMLYPIMAESWGKLPSYFTPLLLVGTVVPAALTVLGWYRRKTKSSNEDKPQQPG